MAGFQDVLKCINAGKAPAQIMEELSMTHSKLLRVLRGKSMEKHLEMQREMAEAMMTLSVAQAATKVPARLREIACEQDGEAGRRACESLLKRLEEMGGIRLNHVPMRNW